MADPLDTLRAYTDDIDAEMAKFMAAAPTLFGVELSEHSQQALQHLSEYSTRPGKRIRGSLAALAYDTAAGTDHALQAIQIGVVLELMQNYLLIVDDVMDKSTLRRGLPTMHEVYREPSAAFGGEHESNMLAVNIGVLAQHLANLLLSRIAVPAEWLVAAFQVLHTNIAATGFGQLDDLNQQLGREVSEADIISKYRLKSSYYTFVNPLQLGFTLAGKSGEMTMRACEDYGVPAGIAFQLHDDYLGIYGDTNKLGKPSLDDIREGKYTMLVHYALQHAPAADAATMKQLLGKADANLADLQVVQAIMTSSGAREHCEALAHDFARQATGSLEAQSLGTDVFRDELGALVAYAVTREH